MPANFPVEPAHGVSFSGMMTPAIDSAYGECTLYTTNPPAERTGDDRIITISELDGSDRHAAHRTAETHSSKATRSRASR